MAAFESRQLYVERRAGRLAVPTGTRSAIISVCE